MSQYSQFSFVYPSNLSLSVLNCFPCKGFVNRSAIIIEVGQCVTSNSPESMNCLMKKCSELDMFRTI